MRVGRRHPSGVQLEAWFDGEAPEGLGWHLVGCASCFTYLRTLARIRAALRAHALVDGAPPPGEASTGRPTEAVTMTGTRHRPFVPPVPHRRRAPHMSTRAGALAAVPIVLVLVAGLLVSGVVPSPLHPSLSSASGPAVGSLPRTHAAGGTGATGTPQTGPGASATTNGPEAQGTGSPGSVGGAAGPGSGPVAGAAADALRLAVVVPTAGAEAAEGLAVADAVHQAVAQADATGGVAGSPVDLTVVSAEDAGAISALAGRVDAVVGGFGATVPASLPWLLPADPSVAGPEVVPAELTPAEAGSRLGHDLVQRGVTGTVGVVVGSGPDAGLEQGQAGVVPVSAVAAPASGNCLPALTQLQGQVSVVAVAGPASLAGSCVDDLAAMPWQPPGGVLLAPSAVYAGVPASLAGGPVYSVLGLPWPTSQSPGAARFRSAVPGVRSYRALVSFAAAELAIQVARTTGSLRLAEIGWGIWSTDLYDFAGIQNAGAQVVEDGAGTWVSAP